jgi:hypothetical protein
VGDRAEEGAAYANLGIAYKLQGDFSKAIEYHTHRLAVAKEVGDRAGEGRAYGIMQRRWATAYGIIAKEVGDRAGEGRAYEIIQAMRAIESPKPGATLRWLLRQQASTRMSVCERVVNEEALDLAVCRQ